MNLNYRKLGSGHPLIILHGLYGSGDNWLTIGKSLSGFCEVYLLDQRNHGYSPHLEEHNYEVMMEDLKEFMDQQNMGKAMLLGHSMGGKVSMRFAMEYPGMITKLMIADISPGAYINDQNKNHVRVHQNIISALMKLDLAKVGGLGDADSQLSGLLPDERLRKFLMKNLHKGDDNIYQWKINLPVLMKNLHTISDGLDEEKLRESEIRNFPVLFLRGENSDYIDEDDIRLIKNIFPLSNMVTIKNAGHWLHAEQPESFSKIIKRFILS